MNVNPATISIRLELKTFRNHMPIGKEIERVDVNGGINEKRKQGINTQTNKGGLILIDHLFIKISDK